MKEKMGLPGSKHSCPSPHDDGDDSETEIFESPLPGSFPQNSIKEKTQLHDSLVLLHDPHQEKKNDSDKSASILVSEGLKFPKAFRSSSQVETVPTSTRINRGNSLSRSRNISSIRVASLRSSGLRASEMLYNTNEVIGIQGCKNEALGNSGSATLMIPEMPTSIQAIKNPPIHSSYRKYRVESLTARRLFSDTKDVEFDKLETKDDKPSSMDGNEEDDAQGVKDGKYDEQMAMIGDVKDYEHSSAVVNKDYAGPNTKSKIEKDSNLRKQASNTVSSQQRNPIGMHDLCFGKSSEPCLTNTDLSYLDSQDPGEQSQADALNMVDKLVWLNTTGFSQDQEPQNLPPGTCSGPSRTRGAQNLAHLVEYKSPNEKTRVFDWVHGENDKDGGQLFNKNGSSVLVSTGAEDNVDSESKKSKRRSYKGKRGSSVISTKVDKIAKDASKILLQGLQKLPSSDSSKFGSDDRENKLHSADTFILSDELEPGEDANHDNKQTGPADKLRAAVEKLPLNYGEASDKANSHAQCRDALEPSGIGNATQLSSEAIHITCSETSPNRVTEENTHSVAERGGTKFRESKKINGRNLGKATHEASEGHDSRKRTLSNTDHESLANCFKQQKTSKNSVASQGKGRRVQWTEDKGKLQKKHDVKHVRPTKSKQNGKEELEPKADNMGSENVQENQDVVKNIGGKRRKGSNPEEESTSAGEIPSAGGDARVGRITRQTRKLKQGEMHESETSFKNSGAHEDVKDSAKIAKGKKKLATDDLENNAGGAQPVGKRLEGMQPNKDISVAHYTRQVKKYTAEKQKPETRSKTKSPEKEELNNAATIVQRKGKQETLQDTSYKRSNFVSTRKSSKTQLTKEVELTGADAEENVNLSKNPEIHDESGDTCPKFANYVRTKRTKTNKEGSSFKPGQSISVDGLCADTSDREMHQKVGETAVRITRQSMRISRPEATPSALAAISGDKSDLNDTATQSGVQGRKSNRRSTRITTPSGLKIASHGNVASADECQMDLNDTSVNVRYPITCQSPQNANFKSPASAVNGNETTHSSRRELQRKGTPKLTLKRELGKLTTTKSSLLPILKDSARKKRESGSICVLFSHSLDDDLVKQQKKILTKLGGQTTTSPVDCTHFITDKFVRTRNMLEAMASGKPVVTPLWLKNCGQASYFIDEKKYVLKDDKKEKELGFSMSASLASAQQKPLLEGKQVFVTPNTNPDQESTISLVKAAKGQVLNGLKGAFGKKEKNLESVIVISCEEDYEICIPLLKKGARIYSPEFLLNGIVIQKLDSSRDQLFADNVKQMRSSSKHLCQQT